MGLGGSSNTNQGTPERNEGPGTEVQDGLFVFVKAPKGKIASWGESQCDWLRLALGFYFWLQLLLKRAYIY